MADNNNENSSYLFSELWEPDFEKELHGNIELEKAGGLVPYRTRVYPKSGGPPYMTTRWRKPGSMVDSSPIHVVPAAAYQGNLMEIYQSWGGFISQQDKVTDELMQPMVALQEILYKGRMGLLAIQDNRVIGVAAIHEGKNLLAASPLDQMRGGSNTNSIIDTLTQGLNAYEVN